MGHKYNTYVAAAQAPQLGSGSAAAVPVISRAQQCPGCGQAEGSRGGVGRVWLEGEHEEPGKAKPCVGEQGVKHQKQAWKPLHWHCLHVGKPKGYLPNCKHPVTCKVCGHAEKSNANRGRGFCISCEVICGVFPWAHKGKLTFSPC